MLILTRKKGEAIFVGDDTIITFLGIRSGRFALNIEIAGGSEVWVAGIEEKKAFPSDVDVFVIGYNYRSVALGINAPAGVNIVREELKGR